MSLAAATLMVGVFNFILSRLDMVGVSVPSDMHAVVLTYAYVLMFLFRPRSRRNLQPEQEPPCPAAPRGRAG